MSTDTTRKGFLRRAAGLALGVVAAPLLVAETAIDASEYVQGVGPAMEDGGVIYHAGSNGMYLLTAVGEEIPGNLMVVGR